eukprot:jgi/Orpsp1_1/1188950/evm.model.d7180000068455.1
MKRTGAKKIVLCCEEDINKNNITTVLFWNTARPDQPLSLSINFLSAFPIWANEQKKKGLSFCFRLDNVGWSNNVNQPICDNKNILPCPDLIVLGTTQLAYRFNKGETLNLEDYFRKYFKKNGNSIESMMYKYSYYDYHLGNNWLAVPIIVDFRTFRFNITTFDYCKKKGYDIHYPPPYNSDYWGQNYYETWTWEKVIEYAEMITECTKKPGMRFFGSITEDAKFFISLCQSLGIPFITEDINNNIKKCGLRGEENAKKLSILKKLFENHYIESWLNETQIENWQKSQYPENIKELDPFTFSKRMYDFSVVDINGMIIDVLNNE